MKRLIIERLDKDIAIEAQIAELDTPINAAMLEALINRGFVGASGRAASCMGWLWRQWLCKGNELDICRTVHFVIQRGIKFKESSSLNYFRAQHDLYLLHCAIFAGTDSQLKSLAEQVVDAAGFMGNKPEDDGELYQCAWTGMLKHWILGDKAKAKEQFEIIWNAYREPACRGAVKPLVAPWIKEDWNNFNKQQQKDFERIWGVFRKCGGVKSETVGEISVATNNFSIEQLWCWGHCGIALLAHRQGVKIATDELWLPPHALRVVDAAKNFAT